ncbi:MAG: FKBP-type peptidyl-prolyl cis-trans isomerase [Gammaproteobacteria bacterium]|nr:FKBP-type peptidyl-prolyl cis-trans isomerase [Gammaproteobacteria bacterium]
MKRIIISMMTVGLFHNICLAEDRVQPISEEDKISYSVGYQLGEVTKNQSVGLNNDMVLQGVKDALTGNESSLTADERQAALNTLKEKMVAMQKQKATQIAEKNLKESQEFLAANAKKEGVTTTASGLQYKEITAGSGKSPKAEDGVTVHYRGKLLNGTEFDSSYKRNKPATFKVNRVIKGWTEALQLMQEGDKWELYIPPELGYGARGAGRNIPANSALVFEVELISVN